jgi:hypothetical protein
MVWEESNSARMHEYLRVRLQAEMVEVFKAGANRNKKMVFLRRVGLMCNTTPPSPVVHPYNDSTQVGESEIDEFGRDMSVLNLVDVAAGSRVVHVTTDKVHTFDEPSFCYNVRALISCQSQTRAP